MSSGDKNPAVNKAPKTQQPPLKKDKKCLNLQDAKYAKHTSAQEMMHTVKNLFLFVRRGCKINKLPISGFMFRGFIE